MNKKILVISSMLMCLLMLASFFQQSAAATPVGISGRIKINGVYTNNLTVTIKNLQTEHTVTTNTTSTSKGDGFYSCAMTAEQGQTLNISCNNGGTMYYNETSVDISRDVQWLNLSIITNPGENTPSANFSWFPHTIREDMMISFTDQSTDLDNDVVTYVWSIAGTIYTERNPYHIFATSGTKTVTLTVTDAMDHVDICSKVISVLPGYGVGNHPPVANFTQDPSVVYVGNQTLFNSTSTDVDDDISAYGWTINDVSAATTQNLAYVFIYPGNFSVKLTVTDSKGNSDSISKNVEVTKQEGTIQFNITVKVKVHTQAIPNANVSIYQNDTFLDSELTNSTGEAIVHVSESGDYRITVKYTGISEEKNITISNDMIVLFNLDTGSNDTGGNPFNKQTPGFEICVFMISLVAAALILCRGKKQKVK